MTVAARQTRSALDRLLQPRSIALVGLSDNNARRLEGLEPTFRSGCEIFVINPRYERVIGRPAARSLTDLGRPVDCVMSLISAERTTDLAEEAASLDIGGLIMMAAGFAEMGVGGARLQGRLRAAAETGGFAALGPNCLGLENVPRGIRLTGAVKDELKPGGLSIVSQSGAVVTGVTMAGKAAGAGFNLLISSGNEAVTDLADFVDYLAGDPGTKAIGLVFEKVRRPEAFFAAVRRAIGAGKPVVATKLGRSERSQRMAASHTGALTGDAWVYEVALRQLGVTLADDPDELAERLALADKIPAQRWTEVRSLGVVALSGGFASLSYDMAQQEGLAVPALDNLLPWVQERIPSALVANPLDPTGLGTQYWGEIMGQYITSPELDAIIVSETMTVDGESVRSRVRDISEAARKVTKPVVFANASGLPPIWAREYEGEPLAFGRGIRASMRGLHTIGNLVRLQSGPRQMLQPLAPLARPQVATIPAAAGEMLPFAATMELLGEAGLPVAPYALCEPEADPRALGVSFAGPYVVKLADVAHRTEHGAVRLAVAREQIAVAVLELRQLAMASGLPALVALQPMISSRGELMIGIQSSELGPVVALGLGGVFVEALRRVGGRMAPFDLQEAWELIGEFRDLRVLHGFRGSPAWDLEELGRILVSAGRLASAGRDWIASLDLNPVLYGDGGYAAVDALLLVKP